MRILGLDYGTERIGVAISDESGTIALPVGYLDATPEHQLLHRIQELVREKQVGLIVVGMPRNMDGSYGPAAEKVRRFIASLKEIVRVPVRTWDERLTTALAHRIFQEANVSTRKRRRKVDQVAAALLLQSFLDYRLSRPDAAIDDAEE